MSSRPLESREAVLGRVLWLPPFDQLPANSVESVGQTPPIMREAFDHPIVICSRPAERNGEWVHFHIVTSFHNKSLAERFNMSVKKQRKQVNWYLPIAPSQYHPHETESPFGRPRIELDSGRTMSSNSFINAKDVYAIQWRFLTRYQRGSYRLTASSIDGMNERTGRLVVYHPGPQYVPEGVGKPSSPEPSPPLRPSYVVPNVVPPVEQLPPINRWTRIDVVAPFNLAGGNKAVVFVGTLTSDNSSRSQALCLVPEQSLQQSGMQPQPRPQTTVFSTLAILFKTVGQLVRSALSWVWCGCGRGKAETHMV
ncbi:hypothetical protein MPH_00848 [Macrophomina phaseolina MS6]|uniref:Uncharacterized protein n=1 Tax=Macrophomina phaseolina (strain MS6) TaxID=1126212 RepID=K2S4R8_MACPH|nr:hypothetical protein MPH_00848 [Macrophomina phaseolina MS6]